MSFWSHHPKYSISHAKLWTMHMNVQTENVNYANNIAVIVPMSRQGRHAQRCIIWWTPFGVLKSRKLDYHHATFLDSNVYFIRIDIFQWNDLLQGLKNQATVIADHKAANKCVTWLCLISGHKWQIQFKGQGCDIEEITCMVPTCSQKKAATKMIGDKRS